MMTTTDDISKQMDRLEDEARAVLADPNLSPVERRQAFLRLLRRYRVLEEYLAALAAFIRRMRDHRHGRMPDPAEVLRDLLHSLEFTGVRLLVLVVLVAVTYGGGPRSGWVPTALLPGTAKKPVRVGRGGRLIDGPIPRRPNRQFSVAPARGRLFA